MVRQKRKELRNWVLQRIKLFAIATIFMLTNNAMAQSAPTLNSFALSPSVVYVTQPINLSWSSTNATSCLASTGETYASSGNVTYPAGTLPVGSHTFTMYCQGPGGTSNTLSSSIIVQAAPPTPVLNSFAFSPGTIYQDDSVQVSWSSSNATTCDVVGEGSFPASGSDTYPPFSFPVGTHSFSMTCSGAGGSSNTRTTSLTVLQPLPSVPSVPSGLTTSDSSPLTGQSYTVSWNAVSGATSYQLRQNGTPSTTTATSQNLSQANEGTYSYRVSACNAAGCSSQSSAISVSVSEPPQPPAVNLIGFDADYTGYWPSSSSSNDLYIVRESTDGNNEGVTDFILVEQAGGIYSLNANPSAAQISQFNTSTPAGIGYELADLNLDGATDLVLMDASNIASGIVYAATSSQSAPIAYKHIDVEFTEFFADLYQGVQDTDYFYDTALANGWGEWVPYGPYIQSYWDTAILHLSGQTFVPIGLPPSPDPIYFYADVSDAYDPSVQPFWCAINGPNGYRFFNGVWEVLGSYREATFVPDYSYFNEDAVEVAEPIANYLVSEIPASIPPIVFQILEDILGANHDLDDEPAIFNLIKKMGQVLFGFGVEQETALPQILAKVELLYTDIGLTALPPFARHAYLQVTFPNGNKYVTRGGPQQDPEIWPFGYIETQYDLNPTPTSGFLDYGKPIVYRQLIGHTSASEFQVNSSIVAFSDIINACELRYILLTTNSNSYAFQSVPVATGLPRPKAMVWAPGANKVLPCP